MNPRHSPEDLATMVAQDRALGLITVACPQCGITAGVLPNSDTWHAPCFGARMQPVDPKQRQARDKIRVRERVRKYRARVSPDPAAVLHEKIGV